MKRGFQFHPAARACLNYCDSNPTPRTEGVHQKIHTNNRGHQFCWNWHWEWLMLEIMRYNEKDWIILIMFSIRTQKKIRLVLCWDCGRLFFINFSFWLMMMALLLSTLSCPTRPCGHHILTFRQHVSTLTRVNHGFSSSTWPSC